MSLAEALTAITARMTAACVRAGRDPAGVRLVAVSKTQPASAVRAAAAAGQVDFGENRAEEAGPKQAALADLPALRWHMIGHVQSRKAREVIAARFALIHSVDTLKLAERLSREAQAAGHTQAILLECNVSGEASKAGFPAHDSAVWPALLETFGQIVRLPGLRVAGLMTMAPLATDHTTARPCFRRLAELRAAAQARWPGLAWPELSMGMTDDFEGAIAEGATLIRLGRAIFGARPG